MQSALIDFWRRCELVAAPFAHPDDLPVLRRKLGRHIDEEPRDFPGFVSGPRFGAFEDTRFHLALLPSPYAGDLDSAEIFVLLLNPGFSFTDYYAETRVPEFRRQKMRTIAQDLKGVEFPFMSLDPEYCWHSGFVYWERKLRDVIRQIARAKFHNRYLDALRDVSCRLAHVELVPYHSPSFSAHSIIDDLPSVHAARRFVREMLASSGGNKTFILTRARAQWALPIEPENLVIYEGSLTRGASLGSNSVGGKAILKHYGIRGTTAPSLAYEWPETGQRRLQRIAREGPESTHSSRSRRSIAMPAHASHRYCLELVGALRAEKERPFTLKAAVKAAVIR